MVERSEELLVDPAVSRVKFDRELDQLRGVASERRAQGWWLLDASFPDVLVAFVSPIVRPAPVLFGALINFANYDLWAPSVVIVDPFTNRPYLRRELAALGLLFQRRIEQPAVEVPGLGMMQANAAQDLLLSHSPDDVPFLCVPGVREYHNHPAHTGDSWLLHKGRGEGTLHFLLETISKYGAEPVRGYQLGFNVSGFARGEPPL